jgi:N-acetylmuramoyl-L-alanine amidase
LLSGVSDTKSRIKEAVSTKEKELKEIAKQQQTKTTYNSAMSVSDSDLDILAKIIYAEARGESYQGKVAVGAVILNRVRSPKYPNTIKGVVFAPKQFSPVGDGSYYSAKPGEDEYNAAKEALSGVDPTNGALTFYAYKYTKSAYHESMTHTVTIGGHKFFK